MTRVLLAFEYRNDDFKEDSKTMGPYFGTLKNKLNQPIFLPRASVKASFGLFVVKVFVNLMAINNKVIACHLNLALKVGSGFFMRHT